MPTRLKSLIKISDLQKDQVEKIFSLAKDYSFQKPKKSENRRNEIAVISHLFFEPSTRTRMSFEAASVRMGYYPQLLDGRSGSSLEKGESIEDTILNVAQMGPACLIIRAGENLDFKKMQDQISIPIINAGWGVTDHPTQSLLDMYTLWRMRQFQKQDEQKISLSNEKLLIVGDVAHSRVAASHQMLANILNYEVAFCGPREWLPSGQEKTSNKVFNQLSEGLEWCSSVMALRAQKERHHSEFQFLDYTKEFGLTQKKLEPYKNSHLVILHPGPINKNFELEEGLLLDARSLIYSQVTNGVYIRQAVIHAILEGI